MQPFTFFISHRRKDTAPIALLLKYEIEKRLQFVRVIVDVAEIKPAEDFPARLMNFIDSSNATIALIGSNWMPKSKAQKEPKSVDWVIHELQYSHENRFVEIVEGQEAVHDRLILPLFVNCEQSLSKTIVPNEIAYISKLQGEHIDYASWPTSIAPLIDRIAVRFDLKKRPDADEYPTPNIAKARTQRLPDAEIAKALCYDDYAGWYVDNFGDADARYLVKMFRFKGFRQATEFMAMVSEYCKIQGHHPEWRNVFNHVTVALTTWDAHRRITIYDLGLALYMNKAASSVNKSK